MTKILSTLPLKYRNFRQAWISTEETRQTIKNLTSRLIDEERNLTAVEQEENALVASSRTSNTKFKKENKSMKSRVTCYNCQMKGHYARDCRAPKKEKKPEERGKNSAAFVTDSNVQIEDDKKWILDSGASAHMTSKKEFFCSFKSVEKVDLNLGNGQKLPVTGAGEIQIECWVEGKWKKSIMTDVWYVEGLKKNLFSEGVITKKGFKVTKLNNVAEIYGDGELKASAVRESNNL